MNTNVKNLINTYYAVLILNRIFVCVYTSIFIIHKLPTDDCQLQSKWWWWPLSYFLHNLIPLIIIADLCLYCLQKTACFLSFSYNNLDLKLGKLEQTDRSCNWYGWYMLCPITCSKREKEHTCFHLIILQVKLDIISNYSYIAGFRSPVLKFHSAT